MSLPANLCVDNALAPADVTNIQRFIDNYEGDLVGSPAPPEGVCGNQGGVAFVSRVRGRYNEVAITGEQILLNKGRRDLRIEIVGRPREKASIMEDKHRRVF
jgi:hypothetical protein